MKVQAKKFSTTNPKRIAIAGFAREGQSVLRFVRKRPEYKNAEIWILDKNSSLPKTLKLPKNIHLKLGPDYLKDLDRFDIVFRTPGIPYSLPEIQKAKKRGTEISSAIKLFFEYCPSKIIGVTGTKGKGTTSTLLYTIIKASHRDVHLAGNIGTPALHILPKLKKSSLVILELSSFQLQDMEASPPIAAVLEMFPDHQDSHKNLREYYSAKANIAAHQKPGDTVFFLKNNDLSAWAASHGKGKKIAVNEKTFTLFQQKDVIMPGFHNFKNAAMAATIAQSLGIPSATIKKVVSTFTGLPYRLQMIRRITGPGGKAVFFYNDSGSHNPSTAAAAAHSFEDDPIILVAGGKDRGLDFSQKK